MIEISFSGRGGQGVVIASQILGLAFFKAGNYPQCYSVFGGERRGAPLASYLRVDSQKILLKCEIKHPNEFLCFDDSLLDPQAISAQLVPGGNILINTRKGPEAFSDLAKQFKVGIIDGVALSQRSGWGDSSTPLWSAPMGVLLVISAGSHCGGNHGNGAHQTGIEQTRCSGCFRASLHR